jgi:MarR family transcriptional regulator, organic hydroperoxide resistance regulator
MKHRNAAGRQTASPGCNGVPAEHVKPHLHLPADTALGYQLRLTDELLRARLQERIAPLGARLAQWNYLRVLWEQDGLSQQELSDRVSRLGPNTAAALNILERSGLVRRERSNTDRRVVRVYLTAKARAKQDAMIRAAVEVIAAATTNIAESDVLTLLRILKQMQDNLTHLQQAL